MAPRTTVAIVGGGQVARERHIPSFLKLKGVHLSCICDMNQELARSTAKSFGIPSVYGDLSEMLNHNNPTIVDICTPPSTHAEIAREAMEAGCHVLIEKPMALSTVECDRTISVAEKTGVRLSVVHNQRFYPAFLKGLKMIEQGVIGEVTGVRVLSSTNSSMYMDNEKHWIHNLPGGVVGETGPHTIYLSLPFLTTVKSIEAYARKSLSASWVHFDDYRFELIGERVTSSILLTHSNKFTADEVDVLGSRGLLRMDLQSMLVTTYKRKSLSPMELASSSLGVSWQIAGGVTRNTLSRLTGNSFLGHDMIIKQFVESVMHGGPVPVPPQEGREVVRVLEEIVRQLSSSEPY